MQIWLEVWGRDYTRIEQACRHAETWGFDGFAYGESPHDLNLDCWTVLAALARVTERIRLGPVIANVLPTYRSALLVARQAATLARIAPGRVELRSGVGASLEQARAWWEPAGVAYPRYAQRLADLTDAVGLWRGRWDADGVEVPVLIAATGDRAMALAARHADAWETSFCTPAEYTRRRARFDAIAQTVAPARRLMRSLEVDGFVAPTPDGVDHVLTAVHAERGGTEELAPVIERALVGTPDAVAAQLRALAAAGVQRVLVALHDPLDLDGIDALGDAVNLLGRDAPSVVGR